MDKSTLGIIAASTPAIFRLFQSFARALPLPSTDYGFYRFFHDFVQDLAGNPDKFGMIRPSFSKLEVTSEPGSSTTKSTIVTEGTGVQTPVNSTIN